MARIDAIISDFGGVLTAPLSDIFGAVREEAGIDLAALGSAMHRAGERAGTNLFYELEKGRIAETDFLAAVSAELGRPLSSLAPRVGAAMRPNEELFAWLRSVHATGVRLAILTNNVREWEPHWRPLLPIDEIFDVVVDSAFVGMRKPDAEIYELTLSELGVPPERAAFVDDLEINVDAARAIGLHAIRFESNAQVIGELEALLADD